MPWVRAGYPFRGTIAWDICQEAPAVVPHGCNVQYAGRIGARLSVFVPHTGFCDYRRPETVEADGPLSQRMGDEKPVTLIQHDDE